MTGVWIAVAAALLASAVVIVLRVAGGRAQHDRRGRRCPTWRTRRRSTETRGRSARSRPPTSCSKSGRCGRSGRRRTSSGSRAPTGASSRACTLGLIRVRYTPDERSVVLLASAAEAAHLPGARIRDGPNARARALAHRARPARRQARARRRLPPDRGAPQPHGGSRPAPACTSRSRSPTSTRRSPRASAVASTNSTQSRIHVIVTHGFLRSLARLDLAESRVGRLAAPDLP